MAANLQRHGLANFVKRFLGQIRSCDSLNIPTLSSFRRGVHNSVYEKNTEEMIQPNTVLDHAIPPQKGEYWAPDPKTGVFGPITDGRPAPPGRSGDIHASGTVESVVEQKTFFRPLEDLELEKPGRT